MHRAVWADGRDVAVKIQYPGAGPALLGDLKQLSRLARVFAVLSPGLDVKPLLAELRERVAEELDYRLEAESQQAFADAYEGDPEVRVPGVLDGSERVLVTEWMEGLPLVTVVREGTPEQRDRAAVLLRAVPVLEPGPRRACCTPTRTPATSGCCPTAGSASSTSARSPGCRTAPPSRSAGSRASRSTATRRRSCRR